MLPRLQSPVRIMAGPRRAKRRDAVLRTSMWPPIPPARFRRKDVELAT